MHAINYSHDGWACCFFEEGISVIKIHLPMQTWYQLRISVSGEKSGKDKWQGQNMIVKIPAGVKLHWGRPWPGVRITKKT